MRTRSPAGGVSVVIGSDVDVLALAAVVIVWVGCISGFCVGFGSRGRGGGERVERIKGF